MFVSVAYAQYNVPPKYEYRAVWLTTIENLDWPKTKVRTESDIAVQQRELTSMLDSLHRLNVNTVLLQTRLRGDVIYPSSHEPFSSVFTGVVGKNPGYDPLAFVIEECHKRGMQLHAWLVALPLGKAEHVRRLGKSSLRVRKPKLCRYYKGQWYMEPAEPEVSQYLSDLVGEIVSKYDVDGIHLDYIRYPDRSGDYPDAPLYRRYSHGETLSEWRRGNITSVVRTIYSRVKQLKPWVRVSCAPLGKYDNLATYSSLGWDAYNTVFQEAQEWLKEGIMDMLFPMLYFSGNDFYPFVRNWQENSYGRHIAPGIGIYRLLPSEGNWSPVEITRQLYTSRAAGAVGSVMFRAEHLLGNIKGGAEIYSRVYSSSALVPPMSWAVDTPLDAPERFYAEYQGDSIILSWSRVPTSPAVPAAKYNIYASYEYPVDLNDVRNLVGRMVADTCFAAPRSVVGKRHWVAVPVDAYGVEGKVSEFVEQGAVPSLYREEFNFPNPSAWGMRITVSDASGVELYNIPYRTCVGVRGLPKGSYLLKVLSREGAVIQRIPFVR